MLCSILTVAPNSPAGAQTCLNCGAAIAPAHPITLRAPQNTDQIIAENPSPELQQVPASAAIETFYDIVAVDTE